MRASITIMCRYVWKMGSHRKFISMTKKWRYLQAFFFLMKARTSSKTNLGLPTNKSSTFIYMRYLSKASYITLVEMSKILQCFYFGQKQEKRKNVSCTSDDYLGGLLILTTVHKLNYRDGYNDCEPLSTSHGQQFTVSLVRCSEQEVKMWLLDWTAS